MIFAVFVTIAIFLQSFCKLAVVFEVPYLGVVIELSHLNGNVHYFNVQKISHSKKN
jgi:hypothetical protein